MNERSEGASFDPVERGEFPEFRYEAFSEGKVHNNPQKNEDVYFVRPDLAIVIDGSTSKSNLTFAGISSGQFASEIVKNIVLKSPGELSGPELVDHISSQFNQRLIDDGYKEVLSDTPEARPSCVFVLAQILEDMVKITQLGDVSLRINGEGLYTNPKEIDVKNSTLRQEVIENLKRDDPNISVDDLLKKGREAIIPMLKRQVAEFQNNPDHPLGYGALDGRKVPEKFVRTFVFQRDEVKTLEIITDGYFKEAEEPTITSWENAFDEVEGIDPHKIGEYPSTKGSTRDSYTDDRTVVILNFKEAVDVVNPFFDVYVSGSFSPENVEIEQGDVPFTGDEKGIVDTEWDKINTQRVSEGKNPYRDEPQIAMATQPMVEDNKLKLKVYPSSFKYSVVIKNPEIASQLPDFKGNMGTNIVVRTEDGKLMVIQRDPDALIKPGAMSVPGGFPDTDKDLDDGIWNPFLTIERETREETGIEKEELGGLTVSGVVINKQSAGPGIMFYGSTRLTSEEIKVRNGLSEDEKKEEDIKIRFIDDDKTEIERAILWWAFSPSPSGASALALYGKNKFGDEWFDHLQKRLSYRNDRLYSKLTDLPADQLKRFEGKPVERLLRKK